MKYRFRIMVRTGLGSATSDPEDSLFVTTDAVRGVVERGTTLTGPTNVTASVGNGTATLTWDPPASDGGYPITGYTIRDESGNPYVPCDVPPTGPLTCTMTDLANDATYDFTVRVLSQESGASAGANSSREVSPPATDDPSRRRLDASPTGRRQICG